MNRVDVAVVFVQAFFIAMLAVSIYLISATIAIPSPLGLGETRVFLVALISPLIVFWSFRLIRYATLQSLEQEGKKDAEEGK